MFSLENHDRKIWEKNAKFMKKHKIQNIAATALGPSPKDRSRSEDSGSYTNISVRPLSVELWRFEVSNRISVPMLYITFCILSFCSDIGVSDNKPKSQPICLVQHNNNNNNYNNNVLVHEGGRKNSIPAIRSRHTQGREKRRPST